MSLKTFFERAATKISETVSAQPKTVDQEFSAKKTQFKTFRDEFQALHRRMAHYFKEMQKTVENWGKISETTKALYYPEDQYSAIESMQRTTAEALQAYDASWAQIKELIAKYEATIKQVAKKITDRDNARVDFDRARAKWEKSNGDSVAEATARASEQVYHQRNHEAVESLDYFLQNRFDNCDAILSLLAESTKRLYSSCSAFPKIDIVSPPPAEPFASQAPAFESALGAPRSPRSQTMDAQPQGRSSQRTVSPRFNTMSDSPTIVRHNANATAPQQPAQQTNSPFVAKKKQQAAPSSPMLERPPARALPPLAKTPRRVRALYDFNPAPDDSEGLAVREGEVLVYKETSDDGEWVFAERGSQGGYVPKNYVEFL